MSEELKRTSRRKIVQLDHYHSLNRADGIRF